MTSSASKYLTVAATGMVTVVVAAMVLRQPSVHAQPEEAGKAVFDRVCAVCHGNTAAGASAPALVPFRRRDSDLLMIVRQGGPQMSALSRQEITDEQVIAVADRKSTRLNSSHSQISYAVFCLKKKKKKKKKREKNNK